VGAGRTVTRRGLRRAHIEAEVLRGCRCTHCGQSAFVGQPVQWDEGELLKGAILCAACQTTYDVVSGVPFLVHYEQPDLVGLFEIVANARSDNSFASRPDVERLEGLLRRYDESEDKLGFAATSTDDFARASWFLNRYTEYLQFNDISRGIDFNDRDVLDVGAGTGHDAWRLTDLGGRVTALEPNPTLIERGRSVVPEARWIGGFAHVLPFEDKTFDVVSCNASLHHIRDIPAAMGEMLRVLRPGGWLLTSGDPFRPSYVDDDHELEVFERHPAVLLGVNESIPTLAELVEACVSRQDKLDVELHVSEPTPRGRARRLADKVLGKKGSGLGEWNTLAAAGGSVAMRVRVRRPVAFEATTQGATMVRAGDYAEVLSDYGAAMGLLLPRLPETLVDRSFPGAQQTKFELLNGWQKPQMGKADRIGYRRARWFLTRPINADLLRFSLKRSTDGRDASVTVRIDGATATIVPLASDQWVDVGVSLVNVPPVARFVCEIELVLAESDDAEFDDYCFAVKGRRFT
jgi:SAM-dependent methyltransferase